MKLTDKQKDKLKMHSVHHTKKHMDEMKRLMRTGMSLQKHTQKLKRKDYKKKLKQKY